jgi:hypothetical protein
VYANEVTDLEHRLPALEAEDDIGRLCTQKQHKTAVRETEASMLHLLHILKRKAQFSSTLCRLVPGPLAG